ncbi:hypothetical protein Tco_0596212, partial [Tanacetum coccineum]
MLTMIWFVASSGFCESEDVRWGGESDLCGTPLRRLEIRDDSVFFYCSKRYSLRLHLQPTGNDLNIAVGSGSSWIDYIVAHQGPVPQTHGVSKTDFERYVTANDAVLRNMQNQGQNLQSQMANLTDMLSKFVTANTTFTFGSGTLPSNTVTNPKEDLKGITTRSGVTIQGPKAFNHDTEVTKDTMPPANNGSTENVQPPVVTPVPKASIPFLSRRNDERRKEKANDQIEKFYEIFRDLSFEISFIDALMLMPKFASTLKTLIGNKEKLSELARTPLN